METAQNSRFFNTRMTSLQMVRGELFAMALTYRSPASGSMRMTLQKQIFYMEVQVDRFHRPEAVRFPLSSRQIFCLERVVRESSLLTMNGWSAETKDGGGQECQLSMAFTTGEEYRMAFNDGRSPGGFDQAMKRLAAYLLVLAEEGEDSREARSVTE